MSKRNNQKTSKYFPAHGWAGIAITAAFWILNWTLPGLRTHWAFFPLWLGYCLVVDALVFFRKGGSMLTRNRYLYVALFFVSIPGWWLFELINLRTQNWFYEGREFFSDWEYFLFASASFSTVMPAVFGTAELVGTFKWLKKIPPKLPVAPTRAMLFGMFATGWLMLLLLLLFPRYFFPLVWVSIYFILEPINFWTKNSSLLEYTGIGDWRPVLALAIGCLICGFFWEMWNFYSFPKWKYQVPFVDFLHIFEMPLLGYLGYIPFAFELFALYHLTTRLLGQKKTKAFVQIHPSV